MVRKKIITKVKASSIIEVVVAMVLIMIIFSLAMMIYSNVASQSISATQLRAQALLKNALLKAEQQGNPVNQTYVFNDIMVEQKVDNKTGGNKLVRVELTAFDKNQKELAELKQMVIIHP